MSKKSAAIITGLTIPQINNQLRHLVASMDGTGTSAKQRELKWRANVLSNFDSEAELHRLAPLSLRERAKLINTEMGLTDSLKVTASHIHKHYKAHKIRYKILRLNTAYRRKPNSIAFERDRQNLLHLKDLVAERVE